MKNHPPTLDWFELKDLRRRRLSESVWVPLRQMRTTSTGQHGRVGFSEEFTGIKSLLVPLSSRSEGDTLGWAGPGLPYQHGPTIWDNEYCPTEVNQSLPGTELSIEPVLVQTFPGKDPDIWHLNQDITFALNLLREGDTWVRPDELYLDVVRLLSDSIGPYSLEIKSEFLRDYLCARKMALRVCKFFSRTSVVEEYTYPDQVPEIRTDHSDGNRFEFSIDRIHDGGHPFGATAVIVHLSRNDIDFHEDVPVMPAETSDNVDHEIGERRFAGMPAWRVSGQFWANEWIEPSDHSLRVGEDNLRSTCEFVVSASGEIQNADILNDEDIGRWLWFRADVMEAILQNRGTGLEWYTRYTGSICPGPGWRVPFGVNEMGLITVYAADIGKLPEWHRRMWVAYNITPEGKVAEELLQAQVLAIPAETKAPEEELWRHIRKLDEVCDRRWGGKMFREHRDEAKIIESIHRFRAMNDEKLFALCKDLSRVVIERIDATTINKITPTDGKVREGSMKHLEKALSLEVGSDEARTVVGPLVGIYELRLGDAHLASSDLDSKFELVPIRRNSSLIEQGLQAIEGVVGVLHQVADILETVDKP